MDISSTSAGSLAGLALSTSRPLTTASTPVDTAETKTTSSEPRELGLRVLQAEIRQVLSTRLKFSFGSNGYDSARISVSGVASESLSVANRLLREAPLEAVEELRGLRDEIEDAGKTAREVTAREGGADIDKAMTRIDRGLDSLGDEAARNTVSSASVLTAESTTRQRSTVRIRTQDGDVVTLKFRQRESLSAMSATDGSGSTEKLEINSRSRMDLRVRGDLDDAELEAIKAVFERAQEIAGSFFGGDLAEAFSKASELEFDRSELANVKMKFREREVSRIQFAQTEPYPVLKPAVPVSSIESPSAAAPAGPRTAPDVAPVAPEKPPETAVTSEVADTVAAAPVADDTVDADLLAAAPVSADAAEQPGAIERFVVDVRSYLRSTLQGFEKSDGQRYFYSESFKLSILKSVIEASAPEKIGAVSDRAVAVVDAIDEPYRS